MRIQLEIYFVRIISNSLVLSLSLALSYSLAVSLSRIDFHWHSPKSHASLVSDLGFSKIVAAHGCVVRVGIAQVS